MTYQFLANRGFLWLIAVSAATGISLAVWLTNPRSPDTSTPAPNEFSIPPYSPTPFLNAGPDVAYIGSAACAGCHAENNNSYLHSAHSRAFADVDPKSEPPDGSFYHELSRRSYRVYRKDGQLRHEEVVRAADGKEIERVDLPVKYLVGSGHFSRTYVVEADGFLHESPITWYASKKKWDLSPGYNLAQHPGFERPIGAGCVNCHVGRVSEQGAFNRLSFQEKAIGCENCHGPGSLHQQLHLTKKLAQGEEDLTIVNPRKLSRSLQEAICASCHQSTTAAVLVRGRNADDFRPGRPLSDYWIHYEFKGNNNQMTVVGHIDQLRQSACYKKSGTMTCVSCHDPHRSAEPKDKVAFHREQCLSCHATQACKLELNERITRKGDNCVACHMPRGKTEIPHIAFTHHRIGIHRATPAVKGAEVPELMAVDEVDSRNLLEQKRNLGLAYAMVLNKSAPNSEFARVLQSHAFDNLEAVYNAGMRDGEPTAVLAEMYWMSKDFARAASYARKRSKRQACPQVGAGTHSSFLPNAKVNPEIGRPPRVIWSRPFPFNGPRRACACLRHRILS